MLEFTWGLWHFSVENTRYLTKIWNALASSQPLVCTHQLSLSVCWCWNFFQGFYFYFFLFGWAVKGVWEEGDELGIRVYVWIDRQMNYYGCNFAILVVLYNHGFLSTSFIFTHTFIFEFVVNEKEYIIKDHADWNM